MTVRQLRRLSIIVLTLFLSIFGRENFVHAASPETKSTSKSDVKFRKDLQSVLGVVVTTKHGQMTLRQRKDANGRVRKQLISGPGFNEIQLDQNGDGSVDFWEVSRGPTKVEASQPSRGRFLRLVITDKLPGGLRESTYLLSLNGRLYNLLRSKLFAKNLRYKSDNTPGASRETASFTAVDAPETVDVDSVMTPAALKVRNEHFDVDEASFIKYQASVLGTDLACEAGDSSGSHIASLQRDWWRILKYDNDAQKKELVEQRNELVRTLKASPMFNSSCRKPGDEDSFNKLLDGVASVMLSSSKGEPTNAGKKDSRFLSCLEQHGLGVTAARMETSFLDAVTNPSRKDAAVVCSFELEAGKWASADTSQFIQQVDVHLAAADQNKVSNEFGASVNYQNVMFHEFMHIGGITDETTVHSAEACCGDPSNQRESACGKLDEFVAVETRRIAVEAALARTAGAMSPLKAVLDKGFGSDAQNMMKNFNDGLDQYKRPPDGEFAMGLISNQEFSFCVQSSMGSQKVSRAGADEMCRAKWRTSIREYMDSFFPAGCKKQARSAQRKACDSVTPAMKDSIAAALAQSMLYEKIGCTAPVNALNPSGNRSLFEIASEFSGKMFFGSDVAAADDDDCRTQVDVPVSPIDIIGPKINHSVPGQGSSDAVAPVGTSDDGSVGSPSYGSSRPVQSPLPVTEIDSSSNGRTVAEDRYRRGTDLIGSVGRGLDRARDALLPKAVAGENGAAGARVAPVRLGPEEDFKPYRPDKLPKAQLENPFSATRSIASLDVSAKVTVSGAANLMVGGGGLDLPATANEGADASGKKSGSKGVRGAGAGGAASVSNQLSSGFGVASKSLVAGLDKATEDSLGGLFTLPYKQIEERLKKLEVVEALIVHKISVEDATGRKIGSNRAAEFYKYVSPDQPLQKQGGATASPSKKPSKR